MDTLRRSPAPHNVALFVGLTLGFAALSGFAAADGTGPFNTSTAHALAAPPAPAAIDASVLFPPVAPVTKVVRVNDAPPAAGRSGTTGLPHAAPAVPRSEPPDDDGPADD